MSSKRVTSTVIDWAAFAARVPNNQKQQYLAFKGKCDAYLRNVSALPESLPKVHWDQYTKIPIPGMVEQFKKQYEMLQVPYPEDKYSPKITEIEKVEMENVRVFVSESEDRIAELKTELARWEAMIPISEMTLEEFAENFPDDAINVEKPTMFPHTPDAQPGYVHEETKH